MIERMLKRRTAYYWVILTLAVIILTVTTISARAAAYAKLSDGNYGASGPSYRYGTNYYIQSIKIKGTNVVINGSFVQYLSNNRTKKYSTRKRSLRLSKKCKYYAVDESYVKIGRQDFLRYYKTAPAIGFKIKNHKIVRLTVGP